jgi:hypothetical protein
LLSIIFVTVLTSGIFTRSTQADFLDPVTKTLGCVLNLPDCTASPADTTPTDPPADPPADTANAETPADDTEPPVASFTSVSPMLAGGNSQVVTINGHLTDDSNLAGYTLLINDSTAQQASDLSGTATDISFAWNVAAPNPVPSGQYTITLNVTDQAGKTGTTTTTVTVDNTAPTVDVQGGGIIKSGSISPDVTASDANGPLGYMWTASSDNLDALDFDHSAAEPTFTPDVEGTYVFYLDVTDSLGNVSSHNEFDFGYQQELETVPLPTTTDPTDGLVDQSPSTPAIVAASANPMIKNSSDEVTTNNDTGVLGNTVTAPGQAPPTATIATITPTAKGWSIFGILWYWWLVIIGVVLTAWYFIKKIVTARIPEQS